MARRFMFQVLLAVTLITAGIIVDVLLVDNRPAVRTYHAKAISPDSSALTNSTLNATADRKTSMAKLDSLSDKNQNAVASVILSPDSETTISHPQRHALPRYIVNQTEIYELSTRTNAGDVSLSATPVRGERRLAVASIPLSNVENTSDSELVPKETHRQILRKAIESGSYKNPHATEVDDLIVRYNDRYYKISVSMIGFLANMKLVATLLGIGICLLSILGGIWEIVRASHTLVVALGIRRA